MDIEKLTEAVTGETEKIIVGKKDKIRLVLMAVLAGGHVLIDDVPGVGKTTLIKTISKVLGCSYGRIQFVPDLLPSDIIGMQIYNQKMQEFELRKGPVMTNILLADEINRAIPRTQSALLEAMEEKQITIDSERFELPKPFLVFATQNPVESESTFKLPAAQMDRFLIRITMGYPEKEEERQMLKSSGNGISYEQIKPLMNCETIIKAQKQIDEITVSDTICDYIISICSETRENPNCTLGASPRGAKALFRAAKALAAMEGRNYVIPEDVKEAVHPVLEHRLVVKNSARLQGVTAAGIIDEILTDVSPEPSLEAVAAAYEK